MLQRWYTVFLGTVFSLTVCINLKGKKGVAWKWLFTILYLCVHHRPGLPCVKSSKNTKKDSVSFLKYIV